MASVIQSQAMISATILRCEAIKGHGLLPYSSRHAHLSQTPRADLHPEYEFPSRVCRRPHHGFLQRDDQDRKRLRDLSVRGDARHLLVLIMLMVWQMGLLAAGALVLVVVSLELVYFSSVLYKFASGGCFPLALASLLFLVMYARHYGRERAPRLRRRTACRRSV